MQIWELEASVLSLVFLALAIVKVWALIDAISRPPAAFVAADKQTKAAWLWILGLSLVAHLIFVRPYSLLSILGTVAAFVYILDAKPALAAVTRRR